MQWLNHYAIRHRRHCLFLDAVNRFIMHYMCRPGCKPFCNHDLYRNREQFFRLQQYCFGNRYPYPLPFFHYRLS